MNKSFWAIVILIFIIAVGGVVWYMQNQSMSAGMPDIDRAISSTTTPIASNLGTYPYECDEHVTFTMTPASDMSSIVLAPLNNPSFPATTTLAEASTTSGVRYEGNGTVFTGIGESATLTNNGTTLNCSPISVPDSAPFNFGE